MATHTDAEILDLNLLTPDGRVVEQADPLPAPPRAGDLCPVCQEERLDYDGLLNLSCPRCGPAVVGCFT